MKFGEYQEAAAKTAIYPNRYQNITYPTLGLAGEAGEIANKVKKIQRDHGGKITEEMRDSLCKELGDVLWYLSAICDELDLALDSVAILNISNLADRQKRGALKGSGDNR